MMIFKEGITFSNSLFKIYTFVIVYVISKEGVFMELVDLYNNKREYLNKICERGNITVGEYSLSVHVWILEGDKLWLQKRSKDKKIFPNLWEQSGGGVIHGETSLEAVKRETNEELGIELKDSEIKYVGSYIRVKDIVDVWIVEKNISSEDIKLQIEEVESIKLVSFDEIEAMINKNEIVPTITPSYMMIKNYCNLYKRGNIF